MGDRLSQSFLIKVATETVFPWHLLRANISDPEAFGSFAFFAFFLPFFCGNCL
jgi:hypothetical protein